jgi:general secretion pathway protein E/type IV pilus assembly protein PilB
VAGAIIAVFAQRLVRVLCKQCRVPHKPDPEECRILGVAAENPPQIYAAKQGGCQACGGQGYKGRIAVAEILMFDEEIDEIIANGGSKAEIKAAAQRKGFKSMKDDGILKILDGVTTIESLATVVDVRK